MKEAAEAASAEFDASVQHECRFLRVCNFVLCIFCLGIVHVTCQMSFVVASVCDVCVAARASSENSKRHPFGWWVCLLLDASPLKFAG